MVSRAVLAGLMTMVVFVSGFSVGMLWDSFRKDRIRDELDEISVYSASLFLESQLIDEATCPAYLPLLKDALSDISESLENYRRYSDGSLFGLDRQSVLYRRYLLSNVRYWMLVREYKQTCGWNVSTVIYFFDESCGGACSAMSTRLSYLKQEYGDDLLVFPVNLGLARDDPVANTLLGLYNVTSFPTTVINGEVHRGELSLPELEDLTCVRNC
jgi:hypothetical protein